MKSIWLESGKVAQKHLIQLFADYGVKEQHEVLVALTHSESKLIIKKIFEADQICFTSSFTSGMPSFCLIEDMLDALIKLNLKGKIIRADGGFCEALNNYAKWYSKSAEWIEFFRNNIVLEINTDDEEAENCADSWNRIVYTGKKYEYTRKNRNF